MKFLIPCSTLTRSQKEQSFTLTDGSFLVKATPALAPPPDPADSDARARTIKAGKATLTVQSSSFDDPQFGASRSWP
ncbi:hypothetical protein [Paraburkholderia youngii]|uniref:Uncharacterized protein n=1 Tax=Paraburkholderia youngii TaxID=2782701 RepID=A0A7Y6N4V2_9BURK|nr:hypothetical protein [Paraburkholderia youngii]NUY05806.1 hypothetical protein [Paraburkholderia youngii]